MPLPALSGWNRTGAYADCFRQHGTGWQRSGK